MKSFVLGLLTGSGPLPPLLALALLAALIFAVASRLARYADLIAEETGLGGLWIGTVLLAASTSLPELLTNVNAGLLDAPDIGAGDLLGACLANMLILAMLDLVFARRRILHNVAEAQVILGLVGILLTAIAGLAIVTQGWGRIGHVGLESVAMALSYVGGMALLYRSRAVGPLPVPDGRARGRARGGVRRATLGFAGGTLILGLLTPLLVLTAEAVSREAGVSVTFVGTLLVGVITALPEMVTTITAVRLGALDLAVGNIFGSVAFNMMAFFPLDAAFTRAPVFTAVSRDHLLTVMLAIACIALGAMGILSRARRRPGPVLVESVLIVVLYVAGVWLLYRAGTP
jgi:cation:H+ antiporter